MIDPSGEAVPPLDLGPVRERRPRRRRLSAWPAMLGGALGALSPVATLVAVGFAGGFGRRGELAPALQALCIGGSIALLIGLPIGAATAALAARLPILPTGGPARRWADFGVAFLAGTLATLTLAGLMILASS